MQAKICARRDDEADQAFQERLLLNNIITSCVCLGLLTYSCREFENICINIYMHTRCTSYIFVYIQRIYTRVNVIVCKMGRFRYELAEFQNDLECFGRYLTETESERLYNRG